jgi:ribose transport system permease protein
MTRRRTGLAQTPALADSTNARRWPGLVSRSLLGWGPLVALILLCFAFGMADPGFVTLQNLQTIASRSAIPLILAIGLTFVVVQGSIDLSIEGLMAASSLTFALTVLNSRTGGDAGPLGLVIATTVGAFFGFVNGAVITRLRVPSFMATLGVWSFTGGVAMLLSGGNPPLVRDQTLRSFGLGQTLGIPNLALVALVCLGIGYFLQHWTRFGRYSYVIGGGEDIARLSGIAVDRYKVLAFVFSGCMAGLAGALESARIGIGHSEVGAGQLFAAITAVVIGGTPLSGGRGGVIQSVIGVLIIAVLGSGMIFVGVSPYLQKAVQGAIILVAVVGATWQLRARLRVVK